MGLVYEMLHDCLEEYLAGDQTLEPDDSFDENLENLLKEVDESQD